MIFIISCENATLIENIGIFIETLKYRIALSGVKAYEVGWQPFKKDRMQGSKSGRKGIGHPFTSFYDLYNA